MPFDGRKNNFDEVSSLQPTHLLRIDHEALSKSSQQTG